MHVLEMQHKLMGNSVLERKQQSGYTCTSSMTVIRDNCFPSRMAHCSNRPLVVLEVMPTYTYINILVRGAENTETYSPGSSPLKPQGQ